MFHSVLPVDGEQHVLREVLLSNGAKNERQSSPLSLLRASHGGKCSATKSKQMHTRPLLPTFPFLLHLFYHFLLIIMHFYSATSALNMPGKVLTKSALYVFYLFCCYDCCFRNT